MQKKRKNNKLIETLRILAYLEIRKVEALDAALINNKGILEIVVEDEYDESDYEETSHMMKSSSIRFGDFQGEKFTIDIDNEDVKGD